MKRQTDTHHHQTDTPLFALLVSSSSACARTLPLPNSDQETNPHRERDPANDFANVMGLEECGEKDGEGCLGRRMIAEAHLDYIYTQHVKP